MSKRTNKVSRIRAWANRWREALAVECPHCGAPKGVLCSGWARASKTEEGRPHAMRVREARAQ